MKGLRTLWIALALIIAFTWGVLHLLGVRFSAGDVYPEYSSLRTDPMGSKLLYDSLARMPSLTVARNYLPLDYLSAAPSTVLLLATQLSFFHELEFVDRLQKLAGRGHRVVVAMAPATDDTSGRGEQLGAWPVRIVMPKPGSHFRGAYFTDAAGWTALDRAGDRLFAIEHAFGQGQVVLLADSDPFANGSTIAMDSLPQVSVALGANSRIVFDESHLGILESGSVMGLARRYRMMGLALGLAICAALVLWRNASPFPLPAAGSEPERLAGRTSFSGLVTLLRRHVPAPQLAAVCWQEWYRTNRNRIPPERTRRAAAIASAAADRPLEAIREIQAVVRAKGAH